MRACDVGVRVGSAAVYTEFILKSNDDALDWQQMQLYIYGSILNMIGLTINDYRYEFRFRKEKG